VGIFIAIEPVVDMARTALNVNGSMMSGVLANRLLKKSAEKLGIKEVPVKIITSEVPKDLMAATEDYIPTEIEGYPSRRRAYEATQK